MSPEPRLAWKLAGLLLLALLLRLLCFTGLSLGDDVLYATQALAHAQGHWPPEATHWTTRLGVTLPTTLALTLFGPHPWAFVAWPLLVSTLAVLVCFAIARDLTDTPTAWLAALFMTAYPLELIFATHLFPDALVGVFTALSLWYWIRALRADCSRDYLLAGLWFAVGYLCRESIVLNGPIYLGLWALAGRWRRPRLPLVAVVPLLVVGLECLLWGITTGEPLYRWQAVKAQQLDAGNRELIDQRFHGGGFWTDPLLMVVGNPGLGLYLLTALPLAVGALLKRPALRPLALWLLLGFVWTYYGTTVPWDWVTQSRESRYASALTIPAVILIAAMLQGLRPRLRGVLAGLLLATGLAAASLDRGRSVLTPHRALLREPYVDACVIEPFEYVALRWEAGTGLVPGRCASDLGRGAVVRMLGAIGQTEFARLEEARYVVFSPAHRPDLLQRLKQEGWTTHAELPATARSGRAALARLLALVPGQKERAERIAHPPGLVVLTRPAR